MMQLVAQKHRQFLDLGRGDHQFGHREATGKIDNLLGKFVWSEPQVDQPLAYRSVLGVYQALLEQFQQPSDTCLNFLVILTHLAQAADAIQALRR